MRTTGLLLISVVVLLLTACPRGTEQSATTNTDSSVSSSTGVSTKAPAAMEFDQDQLLVSLAGDKSDNRNFALLAIVNFDLKGYREPVLELAGDDPVAAITAAAVYGETAPTLAYYFAGEETERIDAILGTVFGLECAAQIPSGLWVELLGSTTEAGTDKLLWGLAQLDVEPGGPIQRSTELQAVLEECWSDAPESVATYRRGAIDAILGTANGRTIDWQPYIDFVLESPWNATQWQALLRWADTGTWNSIVLTKGADDRIRYQLARALALVGPADVRLPGGLGIWAGIDASLEYRVNRFTSGFEDEIEMPELDVLLEEADKRIKAGETVQESDFTPRVLVDVKTLLEYSLVHHREANITRIIEALDVLPSRTRAGLMAIIMRRNPSALTDDLLARTIALDDHEVSYFLLSGWFDREAVRSSGVPQLVFSHPGSSNLLTAYAYQRWLEENGYAGTD